MEEGEGEGVRHGVVCVIEVSDLSKEGEGCSETTWSWGEEKFENIRFGWYIARCFTSLTPVIVKQGMIDTADDDYSFADLEMYVAMDVKGSQSQ